MTNMLDWDSLRFFFAFVHEGSLATAARSLGVEHATVARRIADFRVDCAGNRFHSMADR